MVYYTSAMTPEKYTAAVLRTENAHLSLMDRKLNYLLGLAGETGEAVDLHKKEIYHFHTVPREAKVKEYGDVLWYLTALAAQDGITLGEIMATNVAKLQARYPEGFDPLRSQQRAPDDE